METLLYKYQPFWSLEHSFLSFNTQESLIFSKLSKTLKVSLSFTSTMVEPSRRKIPTRRKIASRAPQQGVKFFTKMRGTYYPDLVRAFYFNYKFRDGVGFTKVKGVDIILDDDIWENVAQFPIHDATSPIITAGIEGFNRIFAYRSFMRRPDKEIGHQLLAGPLKVDEHLLHYLIVWIYVHVVQITHSAVKQIF